MDLILVHVMGFTIIMIRFLYSQCERVIMIVVKGVDQLGEDEW